MKCRCRGISTAGGAGCRHLPIGLHWIPLEARVRLREYHNAEVLDVTAPNADTLCTTARLDVSR